MLETSIKEYLEWRMRHEAAMVLGDFARRDYKNGWRRFCFVVEILKALEEPRGFLDVPDGT